MAKAFASENFEAGNYFDISIKRNIDGIQLGEPALPIINNDGRCAVELNPIEQWVSKMPNCEEGGMIGSGLLSVEDAQKMKEFLLSEGFKNHMANLSKAFVKAPVDIAIEIKDLAKAILNIACSRLMRKF